MSLEEINLPAAREAGRRAEAQRERPFYFNLALWGEEFRRYFLEYCLPSLLSPRNVPALASARGSKFLIATRSEDWKILSATAIFARLREHVEPVFLELPTAPAGGLQSNYNGLGYNLGLMGVGHRLASAIAFRDRAYAVYLAPDSMLSDGSIERLEKHAMNGIELILCAALRLGEEPFFANLAKAGALPPGSRGQSGTPLAISGRAMVAAALDGLHTQTLAYEWDAPYFFARRPSAIWWRVPGERGLLIHCLNWMPLLLDFGAVAAYDDSSLETWTLDGEYVYKNIGGSQSIHVVQDSDEMFMASWAPLADRPSKVSSRYRRWPGLESLHRQISDTCKGVEFRDAFRSGYFDPLKQRCFFLPIRWHADDLVPEWERAESAAHALLARYVAPPGPAEDAWSHWGAHLFVVLPIRVRARVREYAEYRAIVRECLSRMMCGDIATWRRVLRRLRISLGQIFA